MRLGILCCYLACSGGLPAGGMDVVTWGSTRDPNPTVTHGTLRTLRVELLCTVHSFLYQRSLVPSLGRGNAIADALSLPRDAVEDVVVDRLHARSPDVEERARDDTGCVAVEVPSSVDAGNGRRRPPHAGDVLTVSTPSGSAQAIVPAGVRPGECFIAPQLIPGNRSDVDIIAVEVPPGFCDGSVVNVSAVGGHVRARVPRGFTPGDIFYKEYHPTYERNPEIRLKFRLVQPFAELQPTRGLRGERLPSGQYPLELMEREILRRLEAGQCGVTHVSVHFAQDGGASSPAQMGWGEQDVVLLGQLWDAAERGEVEAVVALLETMQRNGWLASLINRSGPVSGCTALHLAARWGHVDVLQELLCHGGADCKRRDAKGRTPEQVALQMQHHRAAALLEHERECEEQRRRDGAAQAELAAQVARTGESPAPLFEEATEAHREQTLANQPEVLARRQAVAKAARLQAAQLATAQEEQRQAEKRRHGTEHCRWKEQQIDDAVRLITTMQHYCAPTALGFMERGQCEDLVRSELINLDLPALQDRARRSGVGALDLQEALKGRAHEPRAAVVQLIVDREVQIALETPEVESWPDLAVSRRLALAA